jgi:hypothetical protein
MKSLIVSFLFRTLHFANKDLMPSAFFKELFGEIAEGLSHLGLTLSMIALC